MGLGGYTQLDLKMARAPSMKTKLRSSKALTRSQYQRLNKPLNGKFNAEKWRKGWRRKLELYAFPTSCQLTGSKPNI